MTALTQYQRLEAPGLWRAGAEAQRRDVIVSFGDASLVITDQREVALTHWSLAAVKRMNPGERPAIFTPDGNPNEELELDDPTMIEAIGKVSAAIDRARPHHGRLRLRLLAVTVLALTAAAVFWLPGALRLHTARVVPASVRQDIGQAIAARATALAGAPCADAAGRAALARLGKQVFPDQPLHLVVLPGGLPDATHLPGHIVLLNRSVVEDHEEADVVAGYIVAETVRAQLRDPMDELLENAGIIASLRLLTTGTLPESALDRFARARLGAAPAPVPVEALLDGFARAGLPSTPYAFARDPSGETTLGLIEGDPMRGQPGPALISDGDWIRLQGICGA